MFWNRFYSLCIQNNTKPLNVATNLHFSSGSITKWKKGSVPSGETLLKIANYFNVSIDYLLGNNNPHSAFTERFHILLNENKEVKQQDIVDATGIDKTSISKYVNGKAIPNSKNLFKIATFFMVSPSWLSGTDDKREASYAESDVNVLTVSEPVSENKLELIDLIKAAELSDQQISIIKSLIDSYNK